MKRVFIIGASMSLIAYCIGQLLPPDWLDDARVQTLADSVCPTWQRRRTTQELVGSVILLHVTCDDRKPITLGVKVN